MPRCPAQEGMPEVKELPEIVNREWNNACKSLATMGQSNHFYRIPKG